MTTSHCRLSRSSIRNHGDAVAFRNIKSRALADRGQKEGCVPPLDPLPGPLKAGDTMAYFPEIDRVRYEGPDSNNPLGFRHYNPEEVVEGKAMRDHLRF